MSGAGFPEAKLREAIAGLAEVAEGGDDCPAAERIVMSGSGELDPTDDEGVLLHLARCTACATAWRIAREVGPNPAPLVHPAVRRPLLARSWVRLAAAAAVLLVVVGAGVLLLVPDRERPAVFREQVDDLLRSTVAEDERLPRERFVLRWSAGPEGTSYDVIVTNTRLETVSRARGLVSNEFRVPPVDLEGLRPGSSVYWKVTAQLPDGHRIESNTFIVKVE